MIQKDTIILWNRQVGPTYFHMGLSCTEGFETAIPGQFVTLRANRQQTPLLRRPFSIHRLIRENNSVRGVEILYRAVGTCTRHLSTLVKGDRVNILGPLGNGFPTSNIGRSYLVAGGIGVAPMIFLAETLQKTRTEPSGDIMFLGGRTKEDLLCTDEFQRAGMSVQLSTDDGSLGYKGLVTDLLEKAVATKRPDWIFACGPMPMLKTVARFAQSNHIPCQVSIETLMACGLGVCLGCAMDDNKVTEKYRHVCIDGPVFDAATLTFPS